QENIVRRIHELRARSRNSAVTKVESFVESVTRAATVPVEQVAKEAAAPGAPPPKSPKAASAPHSGNETGPQVPGKGPPVRVVIRPENVSTVAAFFESLGPVFETLASAALVAVLVIYLLINREDVRNRALRLIGEGHMTATTKALDDAAQSLSRYL